MNFYNDKTYIGVSLGVIPEYGKTYLFIANGYLHLGKCIKKDCHYNWAMEELETSKIYYPYNNDIIDMSEKLTSKYSVDVNIDYQGNGCDLKEKCKSHELSEKIKEKFNK